MKRGGIKRRTEDDNGRRIYSTLDRGEGLRQTKWGTRAAAKKATWRDVFLPEWMLAEDAPDLTPYEKAFKAFVQTLPCVCCGRPGPSTASHVTLSANQKGTGMKVDHLQVVPHCEVDGNACHPQWEQRRGRFSGWSKDRRYDEARRWVATVHEVLRVGDDKTHALDLQAAELGTVIEKPDGTWSWLPAGPVYAAERAA